MIPRGFHMSMTANTGRLQAQVLEDTSCDDSKSTLSSAPAGVDSATPRRVALPLLATARPVTRGDCAEGQRPCPWADCRYHLGPDAGAESCVLDVAEDGEHTQAAIGELLGCREQVVAATELRALGKLAAALAASLGETGVAAALRERLDRRAAGRQRGKQARAAGLHRHRQETSVGAAWEVVCAWALGGNLEAEAVVEHREIARALSAAGWRVRPVLEALAVAGLVELEPASGRRFALTARHRLRLDRSA